MAIAPDIMERLLVELCRFLIEAADAAREIAPQRSPEIAAYDLACANAAVETLRHAIAMRDRDIARNPLRDVAARLGITLDETDPDWQRLAFRALRVMLEAEEENGRRDRGDFGRPSGTLQAARDLIDRGPLASAPHLIRQTASALPQAPRQDPEIMPTMCRDTSNAEAPSVSSEPVRTDSAREAHLAPTATEAANEPPEPPRAERSCPTIDEASELYIDLRSKGYKSFKATEQVNEKAGKSWARNTAPNVRSTARLFSRILGGRRFDQITNQDLKEAWELIARIPHTYQAKTSKLSPQEAADNADATEKHIAEITRARLEKQGASPGKIESEILKGRIKRLRTATIYRHMQDFQRICIFLKKRGYLTENIMEDHIWETAEYERREILEEDNERLTWCGKLDGLFRTPIFQDRLEDVGDPMFWAPLIAVHMGLRSEEVLQLYLEDVQVIDDIPCIVLKQGPGQSLKSKASRRTIPIHDNLLKLGFLQLVAMLRRAGKPRLFPWLARSENKKTYTETFSKRFTRYRQDHKIYDTQRDFHSFRTTFNHLLIQAECPDSQRWALMGHVKRDVGITNYNPGGFALSKLRNRVNSRRMEAAQRYQTETFQAECESVAYVERARAACPKVFLSAIALAAMVIYWL
ncbi:tyrosine-type recombinase/integrase [Rhodosalinus sp. 5P4]|uniref:site-specific integrase n=1 Tax=Rhodosalinus sp. 5P4 TaxID=3239196 RepID=UPI0035249461